MKLKFLFVLSVLVFALHSCSKDEPKVEANNPPELEDTTLTIPENAASGTVLITLATTDEDGDALGYDVEGNLGPFNLSNIGVLTLSGELDYDETKTYTFTINAYDGKSSASATFTINVTKVEPENQAPIIEDQGFQVQEDAASGVVIYKLVNFEDPEGDALTFEITQNDNDLFVINDQAEISLGQNKSLDYETTTSHEITVAVSDEINTTEIKVTVTVNNVVDAPLVLEETSFVLEFKTIMENEQIGVGTDFFNDGYDYLIDWGDDSPIEHITSSTEPTHIYSEEGTHSVSINGSFPRVIFNDRPWATNLTGILNWGSIEWESFEDAFYGCTQLENYAASDAPDLSNVTNMSSMFDHASSFNGDVSNWDVSNITNMSYMFAGAFAFNQYLGDWNISSIQNMDHMLDFSGLSITNYDNTLMNWAILIGQNDGPNNITLGANGLLYCDDNAKDARNGLIEFFGWTFEGDQECP